MRYENNKIVYEVGDWIISRTDSEPVAFRISKVGEKDELFDKKDGGWLYPYQSNLATQEEIDKATGEEKIMVGNDEVEFYTVEGSTPHAIKVGCVKVDKKLFLKIGKRAEWL